MFAKPQEEHKWLDQLIGDWSFEHNCNMPDGNASTAQGKMTCRSLGGMWLIAESNGDSPGGGTWSSIMTIGFDTVLNRYVGTFVGSMMSNVWQYEGIVDATAKRLPMACEGPKFDGSGRCQYRDTIEIVDSDNWLMTSEMQTDDGRWIKFLDATHQRD